MAPARRTAPPCPRPRIPPRGEGPRRAAVCARQGQRRRAHKGAQVVQQTPARASPRRARRAKRSDEASPCRRARARARCHWLRFRSDPPRPAPAPWPGRAGRAEAAAAAAARARARARARADPPPPPQIRAKIVMAGHRAQAQPRRRARWSKPQRARQGRRGPVGTISLSPSPPLRPVLHRAARQARHHLGQRTRRHGLARPHAVPLHRVRRDGPGNSRCARCAHASAATSTHAHAPPAAALWHRPARARTASSNTVKRRAGTAWRPAPPRMLGPGGPRIDEYVTRAAPRRPQHGAHAGPHVPAPQRQRRHHVRVVAVVTLNEMKEPVPQRVLPHSVRMRHSQ